ncbi:hypothetical protein CTAYLR_002220 [Chrysophaeum taylorii]|uniref:CRAL-TRIO domain-containing protein n=1 Tax=Chrysophaeum taylorii TaxID=2483200 RepID=A0AAD7XN75_9STRA|nr:hypothetical protein CTAYLR_002220 [Chrysophaeum taylorii]
MDLTTLREVSSTWRREVKSSGLVRSLLTKKRVKGVPALYVEECGPQEAARRWEQTVAFRKEHGIDEILEEPQPDFEAIKRTYPHFLRGRTSDGSVLVVEQLGKLDISQLPATADVTRHFCWIHEYLARRYDGEDTRILSVVDVSGLEWSQLVSSKALQLLRAATAVQDKLVPFRTRHLIIANAPSWFAAAFRILPLPANLKRKVRVVDDFSGVFSGDRLPTTHELENHPDELELREAVQRDGTFSEQEDEEADDDDDDFFSTADSEDAFFLDARAHLRPGELDEEEESPDDHASLWWFQRIFS